MVDNTPVWDPKSIADAFNIYFTSIGSKLATECFDESRSNEDNRPINYNRNQVSDASLKSSKSMQSNWVRSGTDPGVVTAHVSRMITLDHATNVKIPH